MARLCPFSRAPRAWRQINVTLTGGPLRLAVMARFILALLAALAISAGPSTASAARTGCAQAMAGPMAAMDQASFAAPDPSSPAKPPCCNHGSKACAKACASLCIAAALTPSALDAPAIFQTLAAAGTTTSSFSPAREPSGFDPPPK